MKILPEKLHISLEKQIDGFYFCSGHDNFLVNELSEKIIDSGKNQGFNEWTRLYIESSSSWDQVYTAIHTPSLFSPKTGLIIQLTNWTFDDAAKVLLTEASQHSNKELIVIVKGPKIERATANTKWFQAMIKHANWIDLPMIYANQMPAWLQQRATTYGLTLTRDHALQITQRTENNLSAAAQALEKLQLLNTTINRTMIDDIVDVSAEYDVFKLIDACLAQDVERVYKIFSSLKHSQFEPIMIIGALARELRIIRDLYHSKNENIPLKTAAQRLGIWESRLPLIQSFMRRHQQSDCQMFLAKLASCDAIAKGAVQGNVWHELFNICIKLTSIEISGV